MSGFTTSTMSQDVSETTEVRKLPARVFQRLAFLLDGGAGSWRELAAVLTKPDSQEPAFTSGNITVLEQQKSPSSELLNHWKISWNKRFPVVADLVKALVSAKLYLAADYLTVEVLKGSPAPRVGEPQATEATSEKLISFSSVASNSTTTTGVTALPRNSVANNALNPIAHPVVTTSAEANDTDYFLPVPHYQYPHLRQITLNFSEKKLQEGGTLLGKGGFGSVHLGRLAQGQLLAIKRLSPGVEKQFMTELETMCRFTHKNVLPLLGYSFDGPQPCLVYAYMCNGSLQDRLACLDNTAPIPWQTRISIAVGTADGLCYLHTCEEKSLVHRDIKSANILLDENMVPKIGDFGLIRIGDDRLHHTVPVTENPCGTRAYMAPEAFRGDVSVKLDTFSFGIILLELLTALPPYDEKRSEVDLLTFIQENEPELSEILDKKAGQWDAQVAESLFEISEKCTADKKRDRPVMTEVLPLLQKLMPP